MNLDAETLRVIIAGGGTGGHLFPGIAVARELEKRFENLEILFVIGRQRMESEILSRYGYKVESISVEGMKGRGWKKGLSVIAGLPKSFFQSISVIKRFLPDFVLGVGGYSAGYYSYIWSEVLDADSVEWFKENGGMKRENGDHFRKTLLSRGGSEDAMKIFKENIAV